MPVTFKVASHEARSATTIKENNSPPDPRQFLNPNHSRRCEEMLQCSLESGIIESLRPMSNGFVDTVLEAYNRHHHLVLRPDDVWMAILCQFSFYVNAHSEELRSKFVQHEGQDELVVQATGNRYTVDFGAMAAQMSANVHENVVDKDLVRWILPNFTTTTPNDTVVSAVFLMGTLKAYFRYSFSTLCGIPSVTLQGEKSDWENILSRIEKLESFGDEPKAWSYLLRPILSRLVQAFEGQPDVGFWSRVAHYQSHGSGATYLSGWITAFSVWTNEGVWQGGSTTDLISGIRLPPTPPPAPSVIPEPTLTQKLLSWLPGFQPRRRFRVGRLPPLTSLILDGKEYPVLTTDDIAFGYCDVDVKLNDNGTIFPCEMVAGHVGMRILDDEWSTVQPHPAWFIYIKREVVEEGTSFDPLDNLGR